MSLLLRASRARSAALLCAPRRFVVTVPEKPEPTSKASRFSKKLQMAQMSDPKAQIEMQVGAHGRPAAFACAASLSPPPKMLTPLLPPVHATSCSGLARGRCRRLYASCQGTATPVWPQPDQCEEQTCLNGSSDTHLIATLVALSRRHQRLHPRLEDGLAQVRVDIPCAQALERVQSGLTVTTDRTPPV